MHFRGEFKVPLKLHKNQNDLPLAPVDVEKLVPNLMDKRNYILHHENLKFYERLGLKITKIHRGIRYEESDFLKQYINLNNDLRTKAENDFEKDFYKLMNNATFGKTMENIRKRISIKFCTSEKQAKKWIDKPNVKRRTIFNENFVAVHMKKTKLFFNKPIYLGSSILDLSKRNMAEFHYDYMKPKYGKKVKKIYGDTDSLVMKFLRKLFMRTLNLI